MSKVAELNEKIAKLEQERNSAARDEFKEFATETFLANPELKNFAFGISGREYNDEGLYEGINGVALNIDESDSILGEYWDKQQYSYKADGLAGEIYKKLTELGEGALTAAFGEYDIVVVNHNEVYIEDATY